MKTLLLGESGGTKTDWCGMNSRGQKVRFITKSLHPSNWSNFDWTTLKEEILRNVDSLPEQLMLYSAGCNKGVNQALLKGYLEGVGFNNVRVRSDLEAAGMAAYGKGDGYVIIAGTGSVLIDFRNGDVNQIIGGLGHVEGDEGSGYYFGKLVIEAWKAENLSGDQERILEDVCKPEELSALLEKGLGKFEIAHLAQLLSSNQELFLDFHLENFNLFQLFHFKELHPKSVAVVGSYGAHNSDVFKSVLTKNGIEVAKVIERPIDVLIEQSVFLVE